MKNKLKTMVNSAILFTMTMTGSLYASQVPSEDEIVNVASNGIQIFFGTLAGFAVIMGGIELYGAFMAHRENVDQGGFGGAQNKVQQKIVAGVMCLIASAIIFIVMRWTQNLFGLA